MGQSGQSIANPTNVDFVFFAMLGIMDIKLSNMDERLNDVYEKLKKHNNLETKVNSLDHGLKKILVHMDKTLKRTNKRVDSVES